MFPVLERVAETNEACKACRYVFAVLCEQPSARTVRISEYSTHPAARPTEEFARHICCLCRSPKPTLPAGKGSCRLYYAGK
jgi:hypothetical protein